MKHGIFQPAVHVALQASKGAQRMVQNTVQTIAFLEMQPHVCHPNWGEGKEISGHSKLNFIFI